MSTKPGELQSGTDRDREMHVTVEADVQSAGATTVLAHLLYDILKKLPVSSDVTLAKDDEGRQTTVTSGRLNFRLQCLPSGDFPDIWRSQLSHRFTLSGDEVRALFGLSRSR